MELHCPKCGESTGLESNSLILKPGKVKVTCAHCYTEWIVCMGFYEETDDPANPVQIWT